MTAPPAQRLALLGRIRVFVKVAAMLVWLLVCLPLFHLWSFGLRARRARRNPWPARFLGGVCWLAGVDVRTVGHRNREGSFFLANHVSWIDIAALASVSGTAFVAHDGLAGVPLLRWLCSLNDTVFIARHDRASVRRQVEQVREAIRDTGALTIFPEGTTSDGTGLLPFKSSLLSALDPLQPGIAVQPVLLDYGAHAAALAWTGDEPGLDNFLRILAAGRQVKVTAHFLPPLQDEALTNRKTIATAAQEAILAKLTSTGN
jgi:1-acyl-sn-glycerol-3-phosphate acyltransferase